MKRSIKQIRIILKQVSSFLLVLLFLFIAAAQLLHQHQGTDESHPEQYGEKGQVQLLDKCAVCDYYHHIQGKQMFSYAQFVLPAVFPKVITMTTHLLTGNYKITVQGFSNKGPPHTA